ncbi:MAG: DUF72 domain-containing protein [Solirubrobacterales bacterium]
MSLYVGTSGWAYKEWKGGFYPDDLPQSRFLTYYGEHLTACEVNATFYRLQSDSTFEKWGAAVPEPFRFATKAHRRITHRKDFALDPESAQFMQRFLDSVTPLGRHLACVLFQFPPFVKRDDRALASVLAALPPELRFACEFRHESWQSSEVEAAIAEAGGTVCIADTEGEAPPELPPGRIAYVRLRHPKYSSKARKNWHELLEREAAKRDVYAFAKHEGVPAGDPFGGVGLAQWLAASGSVRTG